MCCIIDNGRHVPNLNNNYTLALKATRFALVNLLVDINGAIATAGVAKGSLLLRVLRKFSATLL